MAHQATIQAAFQHARQDGGTATRRNMVNGRKSFREALMGKTNRSPPTYQNSSEHKASNGAHPQIFILHSVHMVEMAEELDDAVVLTWSGGIGWEDKGKDFMDQPWCAAPLMCCGDSKYRMR